MPGICAMGPAPGTLLWAGFHPQNFLRVPRGEHRVPSVSACGGCDLSLVPSPCVGAHGGSTRNGHPQRVGDFAPRLLPPGQRSQAPGCAAWWVDLSSLLLELLGSFQKSGRGPARACASPLHPFCSALSGPFRPEACFSCALQTVSRLSRSCPVSASLLCLPVAPSRILFWPQHFNSECSFFV